MNYCHKEISNKLKLFFFNDQFPGQVFILNKGIILIENIKKIIRSINIGFEEVITPTMGPYNIWKESGHVDMFINNMYSVNNGQNKLFLKPMNCPLHKFVFDRLQKFNKDKDIKISEFSFCYRKESSGSLKGLYRLTRFTQDDAHILTLIENIKIHLNNFKNALNLIYKDISNIEYKVYLSTSTNDEFNNILLQNAKDTFGEYFVQIKDMEGAFYGPKIDIHIGEWQCGTFQIDFRNYRKNNKVLIHHAYLGTLERYIAVILENKGYIPFEFTPNKISIININQQNIEYANKIYNYLTNIYDYNQIYFDRSNKDINVKLRKSLNNMYFFNLIIGNKEVENETISIKRFDGEQYNDIKLSTLNEFIKTNKKK